MNVLYYIDFKHGILTSFPSTTHFKVYELLINKLNLFTLFLTKFDNFFK